MIKILGSVAALLIIAGHPVAAAEVPFNERIRIGQALAEQRTHLTLMVVARKGQEQALLTEIERQRIAIRYRADELGYYRLYPKIDQIHDIASHPSVEAVALTSTSQGVLSAQQAGTRGVPHKRSLAEYIEHLSHQRYADGREYMGLGELRRAQPTHDGRGATVAVIEMLPDPEAAELQLAYDLQGRKVKKISGLYAVLNDEPDGMRVQYDFRSGIVRLHDVDVPRDRIVTMSGRRIKMPGSGAYKIGFLDERDVTHGEGDINKDGNPPGTPRTFAVAYDKKRQCAYVDANQDDNLSDESCLQEYMTGGQTGRFRDAKGQPVGPKFFIVPTSQPDIILVGAPFYHTHYTGATVAGHDFLGTKLGGSAPGARLLFVASRPTLDAIIESEIYAARQRDVDVILDMIGPSSAMNHSANLISIVQERIVQHYNKVIVAPAGNSPQVLARVKPSSVGRSTISVGQFFGQHVLEVLEGVQAASGPPLGTSAGPAADGRLKPDLLASSLIVVPRHGFPSGGGRTPGQRTGCDELVEEWEGVCFDGTSAAAPAAAGAAAVVISAAKQRGLKYTAEDIRLALIRTATFFPGHSAHAQGRGLMNVPLAIEYLENRLKSRVAAPRLQVHAPVRTAIGSQLPVPNTGAGLFEREGWLVGQNGARTVSIKRLDGARGDDIYSLALVGNEDGTFVVPETIRLPLGTTVEVPVNIQPKRRGVHSAILQIRTRDGRTIVDDMALTVVAAQPLTQANGFKQTFTESLSGGAAKIHVMVPPGTKQLKVTHDRSVAMTIMVGPFSAVPRNKNLTNATGPDGRTENVYHYPPPGTWEIVVLGPRRPSAQAQSAAAITVEAVVGAPASVSAFDGSSGTRPVTGLIAVKAGAMAGTRGAVKGHIDFRNSSLPALVPLTFAPDSAEFEVSAQVQGSGHDAGFLTATLFRCEAEHCETMSYGIGKDVRLRLQKPEPGEWKLVIDPSQYDSEAPAVTYEVVPVA